ncbi:MAG: type I polyketide synthase [Gemmatimonadaceae bacterium]|nr:type I polyketide synthase [Gemmatimonadaceae bacterium]
MSESPRPTERRDLLRESLVAIDRLQARLDASEQARREPIAIVGIGCRYPGAQNPEEFWALLRDGRDAVRDVPADRWDANAYFDADADAPGKSTTRRGGFLDRVDLFDARFFGISPREAATLDPQQRLLLEVAWETLEDANIAPDRLGGSATGVYIGITTSDYARQLDLGSPGGSDVYAATGNALNAAAGRISFVLGLQGPCLAIDTACSSSLVAVHEACQALRAGECDLALAGGVNVMLSPVASILFSKWGMLATNGQCKTFDAGADGFVRGEGCGMVALRRLSDAQADGDNILAVIRGSAVNSDGRSSGLTVPNGPAQQKVIRRALEMAHIAPADVDYVEAHGTGTPLGDPIEVEALGAVLGVDRSADRPLLLGAVKSTIGHTESASGVAGLIKVVLALRENLLPKQLHFSSPNPRIHWGDGRLRVVSDATPWVRTARPRIAGVSSFGFSGTNAHVVVSDAPLSEHPTPVVDRPLHLLLLSARTPSALRAMAADVRDRLRSGTNAFADVCHSLAVGRARQPERLALVASDATHAAAELSRYLDGAESSVRSGRAESGHAPRQAWLFTGQGAQWSGMGRDLYDTLPVFRDAIDECARILAPLRAHSLTDVMFGAASVPPGMLDETHWTQPALFALEYALAATLRSWGMQPTAVAGHSVGEYVAACFAGALPLDAALTLIAARAELMQALPSGGAMAAIAITEPAARELAEVQSGALSIAAVNGPASVVVSGPAAVVDAVIAQCEGTAVRVNRLTVSHAFHSALMDPVRAPFERTLAGLSFAEPGIPLMTNLTGQPARHGELSTPTYWLQQLRGTVRFADALRSLATAGCDTFIEIGPHPVLLAMARDTVGGASDAWLPLLRRSRPAWPQLLDAMAEFFVRGGQIDMHAFDAPYARRKVSTAHTVFERERYWIDGRTDVAPQPTAPSMPPGAPLIGAPIVSPLPGLQFARTLDHVTPAFVADHVIFGTTLLPGTAFIEIGLEAARAVGLHGAVSITALELSAPLALTSPVHLHVQVEPDVDGRRAVRVMSAVASTDSPLEWRQHATMQIQAAAGIAADLAPAVGAARARCPDVIDTDAFYARLADAGLDFGPTFRGLRELSVGSAEAVGSVRLPADAIFGRDGWLLHPALLDACFHVIGARLAAEATDDADGDTYLPIGVAEITLVQPALHEVNCLVTLHPAVAGQEALRFADLRLETLDGALVAVLRGLQLRRATADSVQRALGTGGMRQMVARVTWTPRAVTAASVALTGRVIIIPDSGDVHLALVRLLASRGVSCAVVTRAALLRDGYASLRPAMAADDSATSPAWVIDCAACDTSTGSWPGAARDHYEHLLHVGQSMLESPATGFAVVIRSALTVVPADVPDLSHAALSGLARTVGVERGDAPALRLHVAEGESGENVAAAIVDALSFARTSPELAWRDGAFLVPRLEPLPELTSAARDRRSLVITERGVLDNLAVVTTRRRALDADEVEIAVRAAGLNFRDVLNALGMYPGDAGPLGSECSGVVTAVGADVIDIRVGDDVVAFATDSFATYAVAKSALTVRKPAALTFDDAVTLPNAYVTAAWALREVANVQPGQRVLVHAAMGGVGLAAMRLAMAAGAQVIATAGSMEKRRRAVEEGAIHAFDSRSVSFAEDVLRVTDGHGVDVVINSLAGDFIDAGMRVVAPGGCFVELGKNNIWSQQDAALRAPHVRYVIVDLGAEIDRDVAAVRRVFAGLVDDVAQGELNPLPVERFALDDAVSAFRHMATARHIGKVVIVPPPPAVSDGLHVRADSTYVVSGGLGGLGLVVAEWLVARGARTLVLLGRRAPAHDADIAIARMRAYGVTVITPAVDVGDAIALRALWRYKLASLPPVRGIVHAAGVTADAPLATQDIARFDRVAAAKLSGTWNLHEVSLDAPLDFFVLFSSSSALFGSAGQAPYAAANAFLDAFAGWRRAQGRVATSYGWGAWGDAGMAASAPDAVRRRWTESGIGLLGRDAALDAMSRTAAGTDAVLEVVALDRTKVLARADASIRSLFGSTGTAPVRGTSAPAAPRLLHELRAAHVDDRYGRLRSHVRAQVSAVLGLAADAVPEDNAGLSELGMDSLMAAELRTRLQQSLEHPLPATMAFEHPNVAALTAFLMLALDLRRATPPDVATIPHATPVDALTDVSEDDLARLLDAELNEAGF